MLQETLSSLNTSNVTSRSRKLLISALYTAYARWNSFSISVVVIVVGAMLTVLFCSCGSGAVVLDVRNEAKISSSSCAFSFHCWIRVRQRSYLPAALDAFGGVTLNITFFGVGSLALTWQGDGVGGICFAGM